MDAKAPLLLVVIEFVKSAQQKHSINASVVSHRIRATDPFEILEQYIIARSEPRALLVLYS